MSARRYLRWIVLVGALTAWGGRAQETQEAFGQDLRLRLVELAGAERMTQTVPSDQILQHFEVGASSLSIWGSTLIDAPLTQYRKKAFILVKKKKKKTGDSDLPPGETTPQPGEPIEEETEVSPTNP